MTEGESPSWGPLEATKSQRREARPSLGAWRCPGPNGWNAGQSGLEFVFGAAADTAGVTSLSLDVALDVGPAPAARP